MKTYIALYNGEKYYVYSIYYSGFPIPKAAMVSILINGDYETVSISEVELIEV
jgi:hypothetical protein